MHPPPTPRKLPAFWIALGLYVVMALGCGLSARQAWRDELGPVVPHDTFPADCSLCHRGNDWHTLREDFHFDHEKSTGVALVGAHQKAQCLRCHNDRGPVKVFAQRGCVGCHEDVHRGKLGKECQSCHDEATWQPRGQIQQHAATRFPLVGAHAAVACFRCHPGAQAGNFERADVRCESCHAQDLARATSPDHLARGWTNACDRCHLPTAWRDARFDHATWPLLGAHSAASCAACHRNGVYAGTPKACVSCHLADYQGTRSPQHANAGFSTECQTCHTSFGWTGANFNHTAWSLTGRHVGAACASCHVGGVYAGTPRACVGCHQAAYAGTTNPNHATAGFPTTCETCHTTTGWTGANFNHGIWPRTGRHASAACSACHAGGVYRSTPRACEGCHLAQYNATTNPKHSTAGFPTTCQTCHASTTTWLGATFNHRFPIKSGAHNGLACTQCHLNSGNYALFSCTHCHEHNQTSMNSKHREVSGYSWVSSACYQCHPNGRH